MCEHWGLTEADIPRNRTRDHTKDAEQEDQSPRLPLPQSSAPRRRECLAPGLRGVTRLGRTSLVLHALSSTFWKTRQWAEASAMSSTSWARISRRSTVTTSFFQLTSRSPATAWSASVWGNLLETMDIYAPAPLQTCEAGVSTGVSRSDPSLSNVGPVACRWNLRATGRVQPEKARTIELCLSRSLPAQPNAAKVANV